MRETMFLAVDIGNTNIVLGVFEKDDLRRVWRVSTDPVRTSDELRVTLQLLFQDISLDFAQVRGCMISSVIPRLAHTMREALKELLEIDPMILTHELDIGVRNAYNPPQDVGADRLANAAGGVERYGAPLIVVDFGTATTFDVISAEPAYLGGVIMPGLEMSADALFQKTSLLPRVSVETPVAVIGRSTSESIRSGLIRGSVAAVDRLIELTREEMGEPDCLVVATGGYAEAMAKLSTELKRVDTRLTLHGLRTIWRRNKERIDNGK